MHQAPQLGHLHMSAQVPRSAYVLTPQKSPVLNPDSAPPVPSAAGSRTTLGCWSPEAPDYPQVGESMQGAMGSKGQSIILKHWKTAV